MSQQAAAPNWQRSIRFKVNLAISGVFLLVMLVLGGYSYVEERDKNLATAIAQLQGMTAFYFDSLNTLMLGDAMDEREELRIKMLERPGITEVRVNRAPAVSDRFGAGLPSQQTIDELDQRALAGESVVEVRESGGRREVTVIEPYQLTEDTRGTDCLECHRRVEAGAVSGSVRLSYSLEQADAAILGSLARKFGALFVLFVLGVFALSALMQRLVRLPVGQALAFAEGIAGGDLDAPIEARSDDELGQLTRALERMRGSLRASIERDREAAAEGLRIKLALDSSGSPTILSDASNRLIYLNSAARTLFELLRPGWDELPAGLPLDQLVGRDLADLLPAGALRDAYARGPDQPCVVDGAIGGRSLRLQLSPVLDAEGVYQGRVSQWQDMTEQLQQAAQERARLDEERRIAAENRRIKVALDQVSANVMLADTERRVIYVNRATRPLRVSMTMARRPPPSSTRALPSERRTRLSPVSVSLFSPLLDDMCQSLRSPVSIRPVSSVTVRRWTTLRLGTDEPVRIARAPFRRLLCPPLCPPRGSDNGCNSMRQVETGDCHNELL